MAKKEKPPADKWVGKLGDDAVKYTERDRNMPVLSSAAKSPTQTVAGMGKILTGDFKGGAKQMWEGAKGGLPWNSMAGFNKPPDPTYVGGSPDALAARRAQMAAGIGQSGDNIQSGLGTSDVGAGMIGSAYDQAGSDRRNALGMAKGGLGNQNNTLQSMLATAGQQGPSAAQAQLQMGLGQTQAAMMGQAAAARGGNQAAAMRTAQANGAQMAGQVGQQAAILRAQEQAQHQAQLLGAQQAAAGMYGGQAQQGFGLASQATGQQAGMGANVGSIGLGQAGVGTAGQGQFLGAQTATDKAQLEADTSQSAAKKAASGGLIGMAGNIIGGLFGGG